MVLAFKLLLLLHEADWREMDDDDDDPVYYIIGGRNLLWFVFDGCS